tara:strand:+ start:109 stop:1038 length:930 start_codon:yes stop_codon:yes gene_type:complete
MNNYKTATQLIKDLKKSNIYFKDFTLTTGGNDFTPDDIDWNFKDILHMDNIHSGFIGHTVNFTDSTISNIYIQTLFGFKFPVNVYQYDSGNDEVTYLSTFLNFLLIVNTKSVQVKNRTDAITTYNVGSSKILLKLFFPFIKYSLTKNYKILMDEDGVMRKRRGELRKWGANFIKYNNRYTFLETMEISKSKCKFKASLFNSKIASKCKIVKKYENGSIKEFVSGQSDAWGLRGLIENNKITIYPRMCDHEGACLDEAKFQNIRIVCPFHNKKISPIHSQNLNNKEISFNYMQIKYQLKFTKNNIKIEFK